MTEPRIAIITMVRRAEFPAAASSLATMAANLGPQRRHFVLLNDERDQEVERRLLERPDTELLTPGVNLGVARGRNTLIDAALGWNADLIASVDDDLLLPNDHIDRMARRMLRLEEQGAKPGVIGPAVIDFHGYAETCLTPTEARAAETGRSGPFESTSDLAAQIKEAWPVIPREIVYHLGVRDWKRHYLSVGGARAGRIRDVLTRLIENIAESWMPNEAPTELRRDRVVMAAVALAGSEPVPVDGIPGGAAMYSAHLVRQIGGMDAAFSPFGYEDADFSIRATQAGFQNYLLPSELVLHDLDSRGKRRDIGSLMFVQGRSRALLGRRNLARPAFVRSLIEAATLGPFFVDQVVRDSPESQNAYGSTYLAGLTAWIAGWTAGCFAEDPGDGATTQMGRRLEIPHHRDVTHAFRARLWPSGPAGLPRGIRATMRLSYTYRPDAHSLEIHRFEIDSPGMIRVVIRGRLDDIPSHDSSDAGSARLTYLDMTVMDEGLIARLDWSLAAIRRAPAGGQINAQFGPRGTQLLTPVRRFLRGRSPQAIDVRVQPAAPITVDECLRLTTSPARAMSRLGITLAHSRR